MVVLILDDRAMCLTVFIDTWRRLLPGILTARPMTDLCWTCQSNNHLIYRGANIPEADKTERLRAQEVLYSIVKLANKSLKGKRKDKCPKKLAPNQVVLSLTIIYCIDKTL